MQWPGVAFAVLAAQAVRSDLRKAKKSSTVFWLYLPAKPADTTRKIEISGAAMPLPNPH
jgi:hypothetical protein